MAPAPDELEALLAACAAALPERAQVLEHVLGDLRRLRRTERELQGRARVLELLATGAGLKDVLEALVLAAEQEQAGMRCSVLLLERGEGRLHNGAAPSLPEHYSHAIEGMRVGPARGSCGTAAFTGERVIVEDVLEHPYWADFRELARGAGFRACWSEPVLSSEHEVVGTFAMYYDEPRQPTEAEIRFIQTTAHLAGIAIQRRRQEAELEAQHEHLERLVRERTAALRTLSSELFLAEERERHRLAQDLHDGLSQQLSLARMKLSALRSEIGVSTTLAELQALLESSNRHARTLTYQLSPPVLHEFGLREALEHLSGDLHRDWGLTVALRSDGEEVALPERERVILYRGARELLINVAKHSGVARASLALEWSPGELRVLVEDRGAGFDDKACKGHSFGIFGTRERLEHVGGGLLVDSRPGQGTLATMWVPLRRAE